jgi:class 3 adenylate cyclase
MICSNCGAENATGLKFCEQCAIPLKKRCAQCGFENSAVARFCGECAAPLRTAALTAQPEATPSVRLLPNEADAAGLDGERKTVTALFADIKGSMELIEDLDPEEARRLVDPALKSMMDAVHRYEGYVAQSTGDGIFALFGAPVAHEDHPQRALLASIKMQEDISGTRASCARRGAHR